MEKSVFETLSTINVNDKVEKKNGLNYLSWIWAWSEVKKRYPSANYFVREFVDERNVARPYLFDENLGYIVQTVVTIDGESIPMQLPVMDGANKAQKNVVYKYSTKYGEKSVEPATMFDINTAIMRCLVKNLAMFGMGAYIYAGEDLPQEQKDDSKELPPLPSKQVEAPKSGAVNTPAPTNNKPKKAKMVKGDNAHYRNAVAKLKDKTVTIEQIELAYELSEDIKKEFQDLIK